MDVSLAALRGRLYALRSWDSTGTTLDNRIRAALNLALDRIAGDIPEALVPDEEHIVLLPDVDGGSETVAAKVATYDSDKRLLFFVDSASVSIAASASKTSWTPTVTGEWDGIMHLEITDSTGRIRRRQSREWFKVTADAVVYYVVSLDRPMPDIIPANGAQSFRIHQPEFFFSDDVMEVLEPAKIYDRKFLRLRRLLRTEMTCLTFKEALQVDPTLVGVTGIFKYPRLRRHRLLLRSTLLNRNFRPRRGKKSTKNQLLPRLTEQVLETVGARFQAHRQAPAQLLTILLRLAPAV